MTFFRVKFIDFIILMVMMGMKFSSIKRAPKLLVNLPFFNPFVRDTLHLQIVLGLFDQSNSKMPKICLQLSH